MSKPLIIFTVFAILVTIAAVATSAYYPNFIAEEKNEFLTEFIRSYFLPFLGIVVTITLTSVTSLHLEVNRLEDRRAQSFPQTKRSIRRSGFSLIISLLVGLVIVVSELFIGRYPTWSSLLFVWAVLVILFDICVLWDLTKAILTIPSSLESGDSDRAS